MKRVLAILLFLGVALALSATGGQEQAAEKIDLKFWKGNANQVEHDYWVDLVARYMQANPNVKVEYGEAPWGNDLETKLNAAFATGSAPDVIGHSIASIAARSDKGQYFPLDDYIARWDGKDDFLPNGYKLGSYKGKVAGLAYYAEPNFFVYRKDYYQEAGLDPARPPRSWEELADYAVRLTKRDGDVIVRSGMNIPYNDLRLVQAFLYQNDYHPFDADGKPTWNSPEFVETIAFMADLYQKQVAIKLAMVANDQQNLFTVDKAAMGIVKPSQYKAMINRDAAYKDRIGTFELGRRKEAGFCGAEFLFINSESKLKDAGWNLIAFAQSKDEMWNRYQKTSIPVLRRSLMDAYVKDNPAINGAVLKAIEIGDGAPRIWWSTTYLFNYVAVIMEESLFGKKSAEQSVKENYELFLKELERMK